MEKIEELEIEIKEIKLRNERVELDKAWETSFLRKFLVAIVTYVLIGIYMTYLNVDKPWLNALVPTAGFVLSTLTLGWVKSLWIIYKSRK